MRTGVRGPRGPIVLLLALPGLLLGGCSGGDSSEPDVDVYGQWQVHSITADRRTIVFQDDEPISLNLSTGQGQSTPGGCEWFLVATEVDGSDVRLDVEPMTAFGCLMVRDLTHGAWPGYLEQVTTGRRDGDGLVLTGPDAEITLVPRGS